jgi:hypothetical protein
LVGWSGHFRKKMTNQLKSNLVREVSQLRE